MSSIDRGTEDVVGRGNGGLSGEDPTSLHHLIPALRAQMASVETEISGLRGDDTNDLVDRVLLGMETANEELRTAEEEIQTQRRQLDDLVRAHLNRKWQHERLLGMVPTPVVVTDPNGTIRSVNAAAAALLNSGVARLLRKPLQAFVAPEDRRELRTDLRNCVSGLSQLRRVVTLTTRHGEHRAELLATATDDLVSRTEVTWLIMAPSIAERAMPMSEKRAALVLGLSELTLVPVQAAEEQEVLGQIARICQTVMGPSSSVTVTIGDPANPHVLSSTDGLAQLVDGAEIAADEGPCRTAWATSTLVRSDDLPNDSRWPVLAQHLDGVDVRTALAYPVQIGDDLIGAVNVYNADLSRQGESEEALEVLATATAAVLHELDVKAQLQSLSDNLRIALDSRAVIEQAKGVLMAQQGCTADEAFQHLADLSMRRNEKLRSIAVRIVQTARQGDRPGSGDGRSR